MGLFGPAKVDHAQKYSPTEDVVSLPRCEKYSLMLTPAAGKDTVNDPSQLPPAEGQTGGLQMYHTVHKFSSLNRLI
jgi:hypothetical protein